MIKSVANPDLHIVKDQWTLQGIYSGQVKKTGRSREDFIVQGEGTMVLKYQNGKVVTHTGGWLADKKHGHGITVKEMDKGNGTELLEKTEGHFLNGKMHGFCYVLSADGTVFEGMFINGKRNGYGRESNR